MFRRNLLIGSLVAGAFVLPSLAGAAGVVNGVCSNCHTMHASQNGSNGAGQADLLLGTSCVGCHATGDNNTSSGVPTSGTFKAPQVDYNAASFINAGGYFKSSGADEYQHNATDYTNADLVMTANIPGSNPAIAYTGNEVTCADCHDQAGAHHNVVASNYRMLGTSAGASTTGDYGPGALATTFPGKRTTASITYNAARMNSVCAACHTDFHGAATGTTPNWVRHPTEVVTVGNTRLGIDTSPTATDSVVLGDDAGKSVLCLSCHVAHGGPYMDLLSFNYSLTNAGSGAQDADGCEVCHSYGTAGM